MFEKMGAIINNEFYKIIVVNDANTDKTENIVKEYPVKLINHRVNRGYGAAIKTGIRNATGDKIVILDSDAQHNPEHIEKIVNLYGFG